jgi:hypothetical protein
MSPAMGANLEDWTGLGHWIATGLKGECCSPAKTDSQERIGFAEDGAGPQIASSLGHRRFKISVAAPVRSRGRAPKLRVAPVQHQKGSLIEPQSAPVGYRP